MFVAELRHFLGCLERGEAPQPGLEEGMAATRLAQALGDGGSWQAGREGTEA
jgi:predicted dehydrogenase